MRVIYFNKKYRNIDLRNYVVTSNYIIKQDKEDIEKLEKYKELMKIL